MLKNIFSSADDRSDKATDPLNPVTLPSQQPMSNPDRAAMTSTNTKQQLLSLLQETQAKLETANSPNSESLRQNIRKARELAGFLTVPGTNPQPQSAPASAGIDPEKIYQIATRIRQATLPLAAFNSAVADIKALLNADRVLIYQLTGAGMGRSIAEAVQTGLTPTLNTEIPQIGFGFEQLTDERTQRTIALINSETSPYQKQILEQYQVQATIAVPILINGYSAATDSYSLGRVWGLLVVHQCDRPRMWSEAETTCLSQLSLELTLAVQPNQPLLQLSQRRDLLAAIEIEAQELMQTTLDNIRHNLQADRAMVVAYNPDWSSTVIAESVGVNWAKAGTSLDLDYSINNENYKPYYVVNDIQAKGFDRCLLESLEPLQMKAYIVVPVLKNNQLVGMLGIYQNSGARNWQESELNAMLEYAKTFSFPIQQTTSRRLAQFQTKKMEQRLQRERGLSKLQERLRSAKDEKTVFQVATQDGRKLLETDRLAIYQFDPDWGGRFIAESAAPGWVDLIETVHIVQDTFLQRTQGGRYKDGECFAVDDIYTVGHQTCHVQLLEQFEARSYMLAPIFGADRKLWGLIAAYQNAHVRKWQEEEVETLRQMGLQVGIAIEQIDYIKQLQKRADQEQTINRITERIRQSLVVDDVFASVVQEIRQASKADRAVVYQFNEDWSGQVIAESVGSGWVSLLVEQAKDEVLAGNRATNDRCILRKWAQKDITEEDTYLQSTKGGKYAQGSKSTAVDDIYAKNFPDCYIQSLEKYQAKAYILAPIFKGGNLWGLLGVYQNDAPRIWDDSERSVIEQVALQIGVALQLAEYLERVRTQEQELSQIVDRERANRQELEQEALRVLKAIGPSFRGDLTVRAPLSETEIGTIADGYNTTIQSLRELVRQVQTAAISVSETSSENNLLVNNLSAQAQQELEQLDRALVQVDLMAASSKEVAEFAQKVEQVVQSANRTVQNGDTLMESTVEEILEIRSTVSTTAKKIKRLGETFQKISKVVNLIENFATQTNLLALNASIEATRAGQYGKGFAVVADEVRSLAYQSANATTEIERLVDEIRIDTNDVTEAMEIGIAQVVQGTNLVNETRQSLSEIVVATGQISELVKAISQSAGTQTKQSQKLSEAMIDVATIANLSSDSALQISESCQQLIATSQVLETSVSRFKVD
ncbi:GAF domain-containing protein [Chamaesiphon minutus]|uniref:Methyl-accepting chemotaxis protein n=1 Tax=Chamaesiphon minutus (strain ATCC 27169 / PCC 6605) TaxID=1173020 RepID=K9UPN0_CHAP6|nr:GAF domain-containing protein [Chamaesiphon minutus]AFY96376.1 methyl-accepting chemotaxis protein [Chamaesiphon minutus PCC 6605]